MDLKVLFTRHGESEANVHRIISNRNLPHKLTAVCISQALALAEILRKWNVKRVIASPIVRAQETGHLIAAELGVPLSVSSALREFDCGRMEGRSDDAAWSAHATVTSAWDEDQDYDCHIRPDGESYHDLQTRFLPFLKSIIAGKGRQSDILLVSHGGLLHQMLPLVLANVDRKFTKSHPLGNCELVVTEPQNTNLVCTEWAGIELK